MLASRYCGEMCDGAVAPDAATPEGACGGNALQVLIGRVAAGDEQAFRRIHDLQWGRLSAAALGITHQRALAADAVQEGFLQLWQNAHRFDATRGNAEAWLLRLVRYRAIDITRRRAHETQGCPATDAVDDSPDPLTTLAARSDAVRLHVCLRCLHPLRRQVVLLSFVDDLPHAEIARTLHMPLGTVKCTLRRSLRMLRKCLDKQDEAAPRSNASYPSGEYRGGGFQVFAGAARRYSSRRSRTSSMPSSLKAIVPSSSSRP